MKYINIFLASSIEELAREREQLEIFIRNVSDSFEEKHQIKIRPILCENLDPVYIVGRKQEEFNKIIRSCDMVFFIFFTKLGQYTHEEFRVAQKQFEEYGKPKIYTYFKLLGPGDTMEEALKVFIDTLDRTWGHYYTTFEHLDTIKLRILLSVKLQELDFADIQIRSGACHIDGVQMMSLEYVAEFANNGLLQKLQEEYTCVEKEYQKVSAQYEVNRSDPNVCIRLAETASRRQSLIKDIQTLQTDIFRITCNMCRNNMEGKVTSRQNQAYRLFEQGNLEGCMRILDSDIIDQEYISTEKMLEKIAVSNAEKYIGEHLTAIDILYTMIDYPQRYAKMLERFEKILPVVKKYGIETHVFTKYLTCLMDQGRYDQANKYIHDVIDFLRRNPTMMTKEEMAQLYITKGNLHAQMTLYDEGYRAYKKACRLLRENSDQLDLLTTAYEGVAKCILAIGRAYRRVCLTEAVSLIDTGDLLAVRTKWLLNDLTNEVYKNMPRSFRVMVDTVLNGMYNHYLSRSFSYQLDNWFRTELFSYRLHPFTLFIRAFQRIHLNRLCMCTQKLLENDPSTKNLFRQAQKHFYLAEYYERFSKKRCQEHYIQAIAVAQKCGPEYDEYLEQYLQSAFMCFWIIYPQDSASTYLQQLRQIRLERLTKNPDKYLLPLYATLAMGHCYYIFQKDKESAIEYLKMAESIYSAYAGRMAKLFMVDSETYMFLTDEQMWFNQWKLADYLPVTE